MGAQSLPNSLPVSTAQTKATSSVANPHHLDADPHPNFHFDADPEPFLSRSGSDFSFDADPDPAFHFDAYPTFTVLRIRIRLFTLLRIRIRNTSYESLLCFRLSN
jgi:hypothetical protein